MARSAPLAEKCVVSAIEDDFAVLASSDSTDEEKLAALKFLGHWVGDIHQPLHAGFQDDRGGNHVRTQGSAKDDRARQKRMERERAAEGDVAEQAVAKLAKILGHLRNGSDHEALAAARRAEALRASLDVDWSVLLSAVELRRFLRQREFEDRLSRM
jgi:S1/P1 Nuclease